MKKLVIIGTGVFSKEVYELCNEHNLYDVACFGVDRQFLKGNIFLGHPVYALEDIEQYVDVQEVEFFIGIHWLQKLNKYKQEKFDQLKAKGYHFANIISPLAHVEYTSIGEGNYIGNMVYVNSSVVLGNNNNFLPQAFIGHDVIIGDHNHFGAACVVGGDCRVGSRNYIGINATVFNDLSIGDKNIIGAGSVVRRSLKNCCMCVAPQPFVKHCGEEEIENYLDFHRRETTDRQYY